MAVVLFPSEWLLRLRGIQSDRGGYMISGGKEGSNGVYKEIQRLRNDTKIVCHDIMMVIM